MIFYRWECARGHRQNHVDIPTIPPSVCSACGWNRGEDAGSWVDHGDPENRVGRVAFGRRGRSLILDGGWRDDEPDYFAQYEAGDLSLEAATDLLAYLASVVDVLECMGYEERGGSDGYSELRAARRARDVLEAAIQDAPHRKVRTS